MSAHAWIVSTPTAAIDRAFDSEQEAETEAARMVRDREASQVVVYGIQVEDEVGVA